MKGKHRIIAARSDATSFRSEAEKHHKAYNADIVDSSSFIWYTYMSYRGIFMKENKLAEMSMDFSVQIIHLVKDLREKHETVIANQIGRSGTSIGANIYEANYAQGKKDFISKLEIALKEASETGYWLELLYRTNIIDESAFRALSDQCTAIRVMLVASCRTAKQNTYTDQ